MARPERFELPTPRFVVWCSIQLSSGGSRSPLLIVHGGTITGCNPAIVPCFDEALTL